MSKIRILLVEDEPQMRANLALMLKLEGFEVIEARQGHEGVAAARHHRPELILCDIAMPELDGYGVLAQLREDPATAAIPFVFLTARGDRRDVRDGMNRGADDYLVKPIERADLLDVIRVRLQRREQIAPARHAPREPAPATLEALGLTPREAEVLFWVARGKTNQELCVLLDVRLTTIKKRLESVFKKLDVDNRTAAAAMALEKLNAS